MLNYIKMGNYFTELRIKNGYTQSVVAELIGVSDKTIQNIELGRFNPMFNTIIKLCDIYEVSLSNLQEFYSKDETLVYLSNLKIYKK